MKKDQLKGTNLFFEVDPVELDTFEEWAEYLESMLHGPCSVWEQDGELILLEIKARVDKVSGMSIEIYPKEHAPPHFHVRSATVDASFRIDNCALLDGKIAKHDYNKIRYWHQHAKPILIERWNSLRPTQCVVGQYRETK
jgi:hypothetical protein